MDTKVWLYVGMVILVYVYISYYYRYPIPKLIQAYESQFHSQLLLEKQPIVLLEVSKTVPELKKEHAGFLLSSTPRMIPSIWTRNKYKYLYLQTTESAEVHLLPPSKKLTREHVPAPEETLLTLQLQPNQVLILPFHWYYYSDKPCFLLGVHDYITWLLP